MIWPNPMVVKRWWLTLHWWAVVTLQAVSIVLLHFDFIESLGKIVKREVLQSQVNLLYIGCCG